MTETAPTNLTERLGFAADARVLIINADDFGMSRASNRGISTLLASGGIDSTTLMTPCSWAPDAARIARENPGFDVGLHLVFTSEWEGYRWGPVGTTGDSSTLVDELGYFPADCATFEQQADPAQIAAEIEAQMQRIIALGVDPSHADNHMGSLYGLETGRDFLEVTLEACARHGLPFRLPRVADLYGTPLPPAIAPMAQQLIDARGAYADELGVVLPDYTWTLPFFLEPGETYESVKADTLEMLAALKPGVTEIYIHPFEVDDELRDISPNCEKRGIELALFQDQDILDVIDGPGINRITWRDLRTLQRGENSVSSR